MTSTGATKYGEMIGVLTRFMGTATLLGLLMVYAFLPGRPDALAVALAFTAQAAGIAGLLLVPVGVARTLPLPAGARRNALTMATLVAGSAVALVTALAAISAGGYALALAIVAWSVWLLATLARGLKHALGVSICLIALPITLVLAQLALAGPLTDWSRAEAIRNAAPLIRDIEAYRTRTGAYPQSLLAVWPDYETGVVGIPSYRYEPHGNAYNLAFEQPRFLLDSLGTREFVVYNPRAEQTMTSHAAWLLLPGPGISRGWYAVRDAGAPGWKSFLFD